MKYNDTVSHMCLTTFIQSTMNVTEKDEVLTEREVDADPSPRPPELHPTPLN